MNQIKVVTFDLDGTLVDTLPDLAAACQMMLEECHAPSRSLEEIGIFVGKGMRVLVERCLTEAGRLPDQATLDKAVKAFQHHYTLINGTYAVCYPGVVEGLQAFAEAGYPMGIVTNKPLAFTKALLDRLDLSVFFRVVIGGDCTPFQKPHPMPLLTAFAALGADAASALHVGDSDTDIDAAREAGCRIFCVPYGYNEGNPVDSNKCDALVSDLPAAFAAAQHSERPRSHDDLA